jgi:hypothetical protein
MRGLAAEILGRLGAPGNDGVVARSLAEMVGDSKLRFSARCQAAEALGRLRYGPGSVSNPSELITAVGRLIVDACEAEGETPPLSRKRLKARLSSAEIAMTGAGEQSRGIAPLAAQSPHQELYAGVLQSLNAMKGQLNDRNLEQDDLADAIEQECEKLQELLKLKSI